MVTMTGAVVASGANAARETKERAEQRQLFRGALLRKTAERWSRHWRRK